MNRQLAARDVRSGTSGYLLSMGLDLGDGWSTGGDRDLLHLKYDEDRAGYDLRFKDTLIRWSEETTTTPRFIYYRQNRGGQQDTHAARRTPDRILDPEQVQDLSLSADLQAIGDLEGWWNEREAEEARIVRDSNPAYRDPQPEAIHRVATQVDGFTGIHYSSTASPPGLRLQKAGQTAVHVSGLSGCERSNFVLLVDLARRVQSFEFDRPLDAIEAVVLIDEIDLNLHPVWQSQIASTLTTLFRQCQLSSRPTRHRCSVESRIAGFACFDRPNRVRRRRPCRSPGAAQATIFRKAFWALRSAIRPSTRWSMSSTRPLIEATRPAHRRSLPRDEIEDERPTTLVLRKRLTSLRDAP